MRTPLPTYSTHPDLANEPQENPFSPSPRGYYSGRPLLTIAYEFHSARNDTFKYNWSSLNHQARANIASEVQRLRRALAESEQAESLLRQELKATQSAETAANESALSNTVRRSIPSVLGRFE